MNRLLYPYVTGADNKRYKCQLRQKSFDENGDPEYLFLNESTGDCYLIKRNSEGWVFVDGNVHFEHWIEELGNYVDGSGV